MNENKKEYVRQAFGSSEYTTSHDFYKKIKIFSQSM